MVPLRLNFLSQSLGDKLAAIYSMENCGRQNGQHFEITGHDLSNQICQLIQLEYVKYTYDDSNGLLSNQLKVSDSTPYYQPFVYRIMRFLEDYYGYRPEKATSIVERQDNESYVVCQFDSRFAEREGYRLKYSEIRKIIKDRVKKQKMYIVGGVESQRYMNDGYDYKFGDLKYLFEVISHADRFVGVDSGMSCIACLMDVPAEVCCLRPIEYDFSRRNRITEEINPTTAEFFCRSFRNVVCFKKSDHIKSND